MPGHPRMGCGFAAIDDAVAVGVDVGVAGLPVGAGLGRRLGERHGSRAGHGESEREDENGFHGDPFGVYAGWAGHVAPAWNMETSGRDGG